jgi:branched-chain amino acid transport system substrate-binding protein
MKEGSMKVAGLRTLFAAFAATVIVTTGAQAQPAPLNIDAILPLTGGSAYSGLADSQTVAAFEKYVNAHGGVRGQPIHFIVSDDQSNPSVAVQLTNAAVARHVPVIAGSGVTATCAAMGAAAAATGPVTFCMSPGYAPPPNSYAFASTATIVSSAHAQLTYAKMRNFRRIAFLVSTDATGIVSAQVYAALLKQPDLRDVELVADERISNSEISAAAQMAKIKAARPDGPLHLNERHLVRDSHARHD